MEMIMNEEKSLGDVTDGVRENSLADVQVVEPSLETQTPEGLDMDAWLSGVRPTRRAIKLYPRGDLVARMEELAGQIEEAGPNENVDDLIDEFEQVKEQFNDGIWFTVEKRSGEWIEQFRKDTGKRLGLKGRLESWSGDEQIRVLMHQVAAQTVSPKITAEQLWRLRDGNEGELNKLIGTVKWVNDYIAESAQVVTRDFSSRRSDTTSG